MVKSCFVMGCKERKRSGTPFTFHRVPRNRERAMQWLKAIGREDTEFSRLRHANICSKHFPPHCFIMDMRGVSLLPGSLPTLNLDIGGGRTVSDEKGKRKTRRIPLHFGEYSEEQIKKSPREALRAFRLAKLTIEHKNKRITKLARSKMYMERKLIQAQTEIDRTAGSLKKELDLKRTKVNLVQNFKQMKRTLLLKRKRNIIKTNKTPDHPLIRPDGTVKIKEEPPFESDEEHSQTDSESDEEPTLPDSEMDSSDLMDEDDWAKTFREDPEDDEVLGIPVQGGLKVGNASVIKSVSSSSEMSPLPSTPNAPVQTISTNSIGPVWQKRMAEGWLHLSGHPVTANTQNGGPIFRVSRATQTPIGDQVDSEDESSDKMTVEKDPDSEDQTFDRFGAFVARKMNALEMNRARFLQHEFGSLLYRIERGLAVVPLSHHPV